MEINLDSKTVFNGRLFNVTVDKVKLSHEREVTREVVHHRGAVGIIPFTQNNKIVLVRQYRYPVKKMLFEIPAGTLEKNEEPIECAKRELIEETGYRAKRFKYLGDIFIAPGYCTEKISLYFAETLEQGQQLSEEDEDIQVVLFDLKEITEKIHCGDIIDAKSICGIYLAKSLMMNQEKTCKLDNL